MESIAIVPVSRPVKATLEVPPSKSYTNRAYIIAALANGRVCLQHPLFSDDTRYMKSALEQMGIHITEEAGNIFIEGQGGQFQPPEKELFVGNAGTTMRFLTTLTTLVPGVTRLTGDERMQKRPIEDLLNCLRQMDLQATSVNRNFCPPLEIHGGSPRGGEIQLAGDKSSQYLTSLLLCAPYFQKDTIIKIKGNLTSKPYVDITLDIMKTFGVHVNNESYQRFTIEAGQRYQSIDYPVEGDASSASYFFAAAAVTGGEVTITNLNPESKQGDIGFARVLEQMGCEVDIGPQKITVRGKPLRGININMNNMPDVAQTLAVVALFAEGKTTLTDIANLRIKETDRLSALGMELHRLGAWVNVGNDFLEIHPNQQKSGNVETYNDHRMAMSFAVAGLIIPGVVIKNPGCVDKSFPDFFDRFQTLYDRP